MKDDVYGDVGLSIINIISEALVAGVVLILVGKIVMFTVTRTARRARIVDRQLHTIREWFWFIWALLAIIILVNILGLTSATAALTVSGLVGLAVTLALQTTLSNVISGLLLINDGTLRIDDDICYFSIKGKVIRIGMRNVLVQTEDGNVAVISHSAIATGAIINLSARSRLMSS